MRYEKIDFLKKVIFGKYYHTTIPLILNSKNSMTYYNLELKTLRGSSEYELT